MKLKFRKNQLEHKESYVKGMLTSVNEVFDIIKCNNERRHKVQTTQESDSGPDTTSYKEAMDYLNQKCSNPDIQTDTFCTIEMHTFSEGLIFFFCQTDYAVEMQYLNYTWSRTAAAWFWSCIP